MLAHAAVMGCVDFVQGILSPPLRMTEGQGRMTRAAEQRPCHSEPLYGATESHGAIMLARAAVMGYVDFVQGILSLRSE